MIRSIVDFRATPCRALPSHFGAPSPSTSILASRALAEGPAGQGTASQELGADGVSAGSTPAGRDTDRLRDRADGAEAAQVPAGLRLRAKSPYLLLGLVVLILDQWSKWMVEAHVAAYDVVTVIPGFLNIIHVQNTGVAFGFLASHGDPKGTLLLLGLGLAALSFVIYYFWIVPLFDRLLHLALGLVMGGAVGNLVDRLVNGGVTDFIDAYYGTYHWHTFNVADSAISVGIGLMVLSAFLQPTPEKPGSAIGGAEGEDPRGADVADRG